MKSSKHKLWFGSLPPKLKIDSGRQRPRSGRRSALNARACYLDKRPDLLDLPWRDESLAAQNPVL